MVLGSAAGPDFLQLLPYPDSNTIVCLRYLESGLWEEHSRAAGSRFSCFCYVAATLLFWRDKAGNGIYSLGISLPLVLESVYT